MRLLDDVRLIESEIFGPAHCQYVREFERSIDQSSTWPAGYELSDF